jgi:hypothetical protein
MEDYVCIYLVMFLFGFVLGTSGSDISNKSTNTHYYKDIGETTLFSSSILYGGREDDSPIGNTAEPSDAVSAIILILFHMFDLRNLVYPS